MVARQALVRVSFTLEATEQLYPQIIPNFSCCVGVRVERLTRSLKPHGAGRGEGQRRLDVMEYRVERES